MRGERQFRGAGWSRLPLLLLLGALTALSATSCRSLLSRPQPQPVLRIGIVPDSPPLAFRQKRQWCGVEADLGRALAQRLDMRPVFIATPPARLADNLLSGKVDILMAGLTVTEERRTQMDFATPYVSVGQAAIIRAEDRLRYNTAIKIRTARTRVGAVADSPGARLVATYFANAELVPFPAAAPAVAALREKKIDVFIHDGPEAWWLTLAHPEQLVLAPSVFAREDVAWAFRPSSIFLRQQANHALADWQKDGTLEAILKRWLPVSK